MTCASSEDSDQTGHPPSLVIVFVVRKKETLLHVGPYIPFNPIRVCGCAGSPDSSLAERRGRTCNSIGFFVLRLITVSIIVREKAEVVEMDYRFIDFVTLKRFLG